MDAHPRGTVGHANDAAKFLRSVATLFGAVFLLVGILGFVPGITTDYDQLKFAGHESEAKLLGIFQVSVLHNIAHLLFGVVGLAVAKNARAAAAYLVGGGLVYLLLFIYGITVGHHSDANFLPLNSADNVLHILLAVAMIALGAIGYRKLRGPVGSQVPA
jgi:hypothetical protein